MSENTKETMIGKNMRARRISLGMTLEDVAHKLEVSRQTVSRYETGVISNLSPDRVKEIACALNTTSAYLLCLIDDPDPKLNYNDLVQRHLQMEQDILSETKDALDKEFNYRKQADERLLNVAHKICFATPEQGITYPAGEAVIGPLNAMRMDVITDFVESNEKYLRVLLNAADEAQWQAGGKLGESTVTDLDEDIFSADDK